MMLRFLLPFSFLSPDCSRKWYGKSIGDNFVIAKGSDNLIYRLYGRLSTYIAEFCSAVTDPSGYFISDDDGDFGMVCALAAWLVEVVNLDGVVVLVHAQRAALSCGD
jgi:hypothetical protein